MRAPGKNCRARFFQSIHTFQKTIVVPVVWMKRVGWKQSLSRPVPMGSPDPVIGANQAGEPGSAAWAHNFLGQYRINGALGTP
ncbi:MULTISPECIES: hypothetical protein [Methylorubrum]|uniref:hypothetical protein n=1 Tax=Methylorubrum TaxID=2282523 RepID=UPI0020A181E1|nr:MULTISPECIES: hypothetical protein [Methylorubrum]MCP1547187.1 hypothetical protein [Methylorubrum zatmanii]MCP1556197.1 hypothetical protein [Methylorubrum extorquens]MCP1577490.1 hypothetical protein [Methylorubrum extorquens]